MRIHSSLLFLLLGSLSAGPVTESVTFGQVTEATWTQPESDWNGGVVLIFHGLSDGMDGAGDANIKLAHNLAEIAGLASLRFTFTGEGRAANYVKSTAASRLRDAEDAYRFVLAREGVDASRIGICGWSMGGATAIYISGRHPDWFSSIVLWSPLVDTDFLGNQKTFAEEARTALREGQVTIRGWKTYTMEPEFFLSWREVDLLEYIRLYPGALLNIQGTQDFLPLVGQTIVGYSLGVRRESLLIGGADHIFNVFNPQLGYFQRTLEATTSFLQETLK